MVFLKELNLARVRNLRDADLSFAQGLNLLFGPNGSGKTAILESIALLCRGQSFRTPNIRSVICHTEQDLAVSGLVADEKRGLLRVGFAKNRSNEVRVQVNGAELHRASELALLMPVQVITADSAALVLGGPKGRRLFLDWGLFHEHTAYLGWRKEYHRALRQRNAWLRERPSQGWGAQLEAWDVRLSEACARITESQGAYVQRVNDLLRDLLLTMKSSPGGEEQIALSYYPGWPEEQGNYLETIRASRQRDVKLGRTVAGPQAADVRIQLGKRSAARVLSRGEAKTLAQAMHLAQAEEMFQATGRRCLFLVDELASELDARARAEFIALLIAKKYQVVAASAVELDEIRGQAARVGDCRLFHVEQGRITEQVDNAMGEKERAQ